MKGWKRLWERLPKLESKSQLIVATVLLLLLPLLAALQYRWLGQVSDGEREYVKANLRATAERFSQDFDQELTRLYAALDPRSFNLAAPADESLEALVAKYEGWRQSAPHPRLVKVVCFTRAKQAQAEAGGQFRLQCLAQASGKFAPCEWPADLRSLHEQFVQRLNNFRRALAGKAPPLPQRLPEGVWGEIPALVLPVRNRPPGPFFFAAGNLRSLRNRGQVERFSPLFPAGFVIVTLDAAYLREALFPALIKRHFDGDAQLYDVAVINPGKTRQVIFATGGAGNQLTQADVTVALFSLRGELLRELLRDRWRVRTFRPQTEGGPNEGAAAPFVLSEAGPQDGGQWQLLIRHRAGSLAAAVANARRRNLLISFGILLLLAASLLLLFISARRAERLAQAQMDFVAGVSHELRTPISVLDAAGYNLARGHIKDAEQMARYGALIRQESRRLTEMVEQILEFAGAQSPRRPHYDWQPTDLKQVIEEALAAPLLVESGFEIETELPSALPLVQADAAALQRALQNLLSNAIKYSGESRWLKVQAQSGAAAVNITVLDRGVGIPASELSHVFEPFYRGQEARAAQIHGNGLGLSLVKKIVEAHGGQVTVASEAGQGSAFTLSLPVQAE